MTDISAGPYGLEAAPNYAINGSRVLLKAIKDATGQSDWFTISHFGGDHAYQFKSFDAPESIVLNDDGTATATVNGRWFTNPGHAGTVAATLVATFRPDRTAHATVTTDHVVWDHEIDVHTTDLGVFIFSVP